jgi:hypothetical protein
MFAFQTELFINPDGFKAAAKIGCRQLIFAVSFRAAKQDHKESIKKGHLL